MLPAGEPSGEMDDFPRRHLSFAHRRTWAILLAGGEGRRLSPLVEQLHADHRPKQYATIIGTRSMLQHTHARALRHAPADRIVAVITEGQERWALEQLPDLPPRNVLVQPQSLDTGPAVLLALAHILEQDSDADVLLLPSDHFIFPEPALTQPIAGAIAALGETGAEPIILLAARPTGPRQDMGWILPGEMVRRKPSLLLRVRRFVEKPPREAAESLYASGGLWNTFILAAGAGAMHRMIERHRPAAAAGVSRYMSLRRQGGRKRELDAAFERIEPFNLSTQVLQREAGALLAAPLSTVRWNDWGTPQGIQESLESLGWSHKFTARVSADELLSARARSSPAAPALAGQGLWEAPS